MFAFCDLDTGEIRFAPRRPNKPALVIAEHVSIVLLREAIRSSGAQEFFEGQDDEVAMTPLLCVPWFSSATSADEKDKRARLFAKKVRDWLGGHPVIQ